MRHALEARDVSVAIGRVRILRGVDLSVAEGEWVAIIGPNGSGKTTLLRAVAGIIPCDGQVLISGREAAGSTRRGLARQIALVPQQPETPYDLTVAEYVLLGRTPHIGYFATERKVDRLAAERAIVRLGLRQFTGRTLGSLSGGELQRVVLARALAQEAPILLLDEPTSALDLGRQQQVLELIDRLRREASLTVVCTMHDLSLAGQYADRLLLLDGGMVVAEGTPTDLLSEAAIAAHYGAEVQVIRENGNVFVLPRRQEARWAR